jgi:hypothetical protein
MTARPLQIDFLKDLPFAEVLVNPHARIPYGVRFGGDRPGPSALFTAPSTTIETVARRMIKLPTLPWIWGHIYLISSDMISSGQQVDVTSCLPNVIFDDITISAASNQDSTDTLDAAYWTVLRLCARLGMIQGRGVATEPIRKPRPNYL